MERSGTARRPQLLGQKQDKFWLTVGLCALTAALIFLPFYLLDGGFFHYAGDFNSQQISFYRYMNGFLKGAGYPAGYEGVKNTFSWATDLGSGTMNAYSFYLYGSPFFWFSLLFPQNWLPYLMVPLLVLKFAVAGGGAYLYLRRYVKDPNFAVLGAALYAFSGWGLYTSSSTTSLMCWPSSLDALGHWMRPSTAPPRMVRLLGGGEPAQQLLLLHGPGAVSCHLLHLQAQHRGVPAHASSVSWPLKASGRWHGQLWCSGPLSSACCRTRAPSTFPPAGAFLPTPSPSSIWPSC